jgi:ferric-dicitrate binding protein FerR (iron transport regulator)
MNEHDDPIAALIRAAGKRPHPDAAAMARVRAAVEEEWRATVRRRRVTRWSAAAAALAAVLACVLLLLPQRAAAPAGEVVVTAESPRSLDWNGNTLRLDARTRVVLLAPRLARLERGTVYFSSEANTPPVTIATPFGDVHDIGTQFETRLTAADVQVRVREGRVELRGATAGAGELLVATQERVTRGADAAEWTWVERAAPPIRLEGMPLDEVVRRVAREKGLTPEWRTPRSTRAIILHGDVPFTLDEALDAATAAAGVSWRVSGRQLVIE